MIDVQNEQVAPRLVTLATRSLDRELADVEAHLLETTIDAMRQQVWREDGHRSVRCWLRATTGWADWRISRCVRNARFCVDAPQVLQWLHHGRITVDRVDTLARAWANPRVRPELLASIDDFLDHATRPHAEFDLLVRRWVDYVDLDGGHRAGDDGHDARHLTLSRADDGTTMFRGELPPAQAAQFRAVLDAYTYTEFLIDRDRAIALHGPDATTAQFPRTHRQRVLDALVRMALDAADHARSLHDTQRRDTTAPAADGPGDEPGSDVDRSAEGRRVLPDPEPSVMVHTDLATLTRALELLRPTSDQTLALQGVGSLTLGQLGEQLTATTDPARLHAETGDGTPLPLADVLTALIIGKVRLVIEDDAGVITHAGRSRRLFTGVQRELVLAAALWCIHPGCDRPGNECEADHLHPHSQGGATDTVNAGPGCGHHNRWRHRHGYTVTRDERGRWHTWRPDGTEV